MKLHPQRKTIRKSYTMKGKNHPFNFTSFLPSDISLKKNGEIKNET